MAKEVKLKKRHKKYPCLKQITNKEAKELLEDVKKMPTDLHKRKYEAWFLYGYNP